MAGLMKPTADWPLAAACWLASAMNEAQRGVPMLVPMSALVWPLSPMLRTLSATIATSGMFRKLVDPWFALMLTPACQVGMAYRVLVPPPLASPTLSFQVVSPAQAPVLLVVSVVPPTTVM